MTESVQNQPGMRRHTRMLLVGLVVFSVLKVINQTYAVPGIDFYQFWVIGQAVEQRPIDNIYATRSREKIGDDFAKQARKKSPGNYQRMVSRYRHVLETYSTPFLYAIFRTFSTGHYVLDMELFRAVSLLCSFFALSVFSRCLGYSWEATLVMIILAIHWYRPLPSDLGVGNVNQVQLGMLAVFIWLQSKRYWRWNHFVSGLVLGAGVMFKPNLVFVALFLVLFWGINQRYRKLKHQLMGMGVAGVFAYGYGCWGLGSWTCWFDWLYAMTLMPGKIVSVALHNYAPARLLLEWRGWHVSMPFFAILMAMVVAGMWKSRRRLQEVSESVPGHDAACRVSASDHEQALREDILMLSLGGLVYLLAGPLVWIHYFVLVIPAVLLILKPGDCTGCCLPAWVTPVCTFIALASLCGATVLPLKLIRFLSPATSINHCLALSTILSSSLFFLFTMRQLWHLRCGVSEA